MRRERESKREGGEREGGREWARDIPHIPVVILPIKEKKNKNQNL